MNRSLSTVVDHRDPFSTIRRHVVDHLDPFIAIRQLVVVLTPSRERAATTSQAPRAKPSETSPSHFRTFLEAVGVRLDLVYVVRDLVVVLG